MAPSLMLLSAVSTPHAAFFAFTTDTNSAGILSKNGATDAHTVNIADLPAGPLKSYLTRTADWSIDAFKRKVIVKLSAAPNGTTPTLPLIGGPPVTQSEGLTVIHASGAIIFTSASSSSATTALTCTIEVRLMHSMSH
jgi:hypothetical protein